MLLLAVANRRGWKTSTAGISSAFSYDDMDVLIYMRMPDGSIIKLLESRYGLEQAAYRFKDYLDKTLTALGFQTLHSDSSVYLGWHNISSTSHVDDVMFLNSNIEDVEEIFSKLCDTYSMTFQATATEYLGYTITGNEEEKSTSFRQNGSITKLLDLFPPESFTKISFSPFLRTEVIDEELLSEADKRFYQQITDSLLHLSICTRPGSSSVSP